MLCRVEVHVPRVERASGHANASLYSERTENPALDQRTGKKGERRERDHRVDNERGDTQRRNWRSENRRNNRETEKQQQQPDRALSPETWRKPIEQPRPSSADSGGMRFGKAASAIELAQAFSRSSVSDPTTDRHSGQRSLPGRTQMPFSRLMSPTQRPQINGY